MCCEGGILLFTLYDQRCTSSLLFVLWIEIVIVAWFYGIQRFVDNIQEMGMKVGLSRPYGVIRILLILLLGVVTPLVLIGVCIIAWMQRAPIEYGGEKFPPVAEGFGWVMELGPLIFLIIMPIWQVFKMRKNDMSTKDIWQALFRPTDSWYEVERDVDTATSDDVEKYSGRDNIAFTKEETKEEHKKETQRRNRSSSSSSSNSSSSDDGKVL